MTDDGDSQNVDNPTTPTAPRKQQRKERPPVFLAGKRAYLGTGRRKTAVARIFLTEGQPPPDENIVNMTQKLRDSGYLTRDSRMKERKKYGRKGARKSFQFSKR